MNEYECSTISLPIPLLSLSLLSYPLSAVSKFFWPQDSFLAEGLW